MQLNRIFIAMVAFLIAFGSYAQDSGPKASMATPKKPAHKKKVFQDSDDKIYWQVSVPVKVSIGAANGTESFQLKTVKNESMKQYSNPMFFDGHGIHYIRHFDYEHPIPENEVAWEVYVDGIAPRTRLTFSDAPKAVRNGTVYYGKGLSGTLKSTDEMSGMDKTYHSINGAAYTVNTSTTSFADENSYEYRYYAVDRVGNDEEERTTSFVVDTSTPTSSHEIAGIRKDMIFSSKVNFDLSSIDKLSGVKRIRWNFDNTAEGTYKQKIWVGYLEDGEHTLNYYAEDYVENVEEKKTVSFYLDKIAPEVVAKIEGDMYEKNGRTYVSERTMFSLSATDNKAGVRNIFYSIDGTNQLEYSAPFKLDRAQGTHNIRFRGVDNVENLGKFKTDNNLGALYLDLTAPTISHYYSGPKFETRDTMFITSETNVHLKALDYQAGVQKIGYKLDEADNEYVEAFQVEKDGYHDVNYYATDHVNNKQEDKFYFIVDNDPPEIFMHFSMESIGTAQMSEEEGGKVEIYAPHSIMYLAATDKAVGTDKIYYTLDDGSEKLYTGPLKNLRKGFRTIKIRATDKLGNESDITTISFMIK
ncbi:MAG: chitobiase/beta-hexosaminidase C-terminal domain-containing protein [Flammeovirgaceae bacterium]